MSWLTEPLEYPFMQRALMEVVIIGVLCGLVGCFVVLRGLAFIGDALAHAVFPGVVLSYVAGRSILFGAFIFGSLTALGIGILSRSRRVSEDSAIGVIFAAFFALGVVILSRQGGFRQDLGSLLFGNILGVSTTDVWVTLVVALIVGGILLGLLKEFTLTAFDPTMARSAGYPVFALDLLLLLLVSATIVVSLQTVGNILILALIVTPPAAARLLTDRLSHMMMASVGLAVFSGVAGLFISYHAATAAGATIVLTATGVFLVCVVLAPNHGLLATSRARRRGRHHAHHFHTNEEIEVS
ncbi:MAG: metal ABC transporter permease [Dehalococcoidia bacterium]|uniref:metal ABC transporter permease n=1 Tax=Candidatus Amarobacter glycogenicus TaxID=3140699 RepID=UPI003135FCFF|nr:metal ABC transporter permease [Dehalococcoidia bacterium]